MKFQALRLKKIALEWPLFFAIVALIQHTNYYYKTISYIYLSNIT